MTISDFCGLVDVIVEERYDLEDGGDLCFNLLEMCVIRIDDGIEHAVRVVAQHLLQP